MDESQDFRAYAIQYVSRLILHELRPIVGDVDSAAAKDIGEPYEASETYRFVQRMRDFLALVQRLEEAASAPEIVEFDLTEVCVRTRNEVSDAPVPIVAGRYDPVATLGDPRHLALALRNILRNAVEASAPTALPIIVNWGIVGDEAWVVVLDDGAGLPDGRDRAWEPGRTTKSSDEHFGWGLTIAEQAVNSFGGTIELAPRDVGGTSCEIRWRTGDIRGEGATG